LRIPDGIYHVTARGNRRQRIFEDRHDHARFLTFLSDVVRRHEWRCHAYCLMPTHYHAVVETPRADISEGIQRLNARYAQSFNRKYEVEGHLFQGRFHSAVVESRWHLVELSRYLPLNPVRAGICFRPEDWEWSSYRALIAMAPLPSFLYAQGVLSIFGRTSGAARAGFAAFVAERRP
jgi:putative transposase